MKYFSLFLTAALLLKNVQPAPITSGNSDIRPIDFLDSADYVTDAITALNNHEKSFVNLEPRSGPGSLTKIIGKGRSRSPSPAGKKITQDGLAQDLKERKQKSIEEQKAKLEITKQSKEDRKIESARRRKEKLLASGKNPDQQNPPTGNKDQKKEDQEIFEITKYTREEIDEYLDKPGKEIKPDDGATKLDDIVEGFKKCMDDDKYLFWTQGAAPKKNPNDRANPFGLYGVARAQELTGRLQLREAADSPRCKAAGIGSLLHRTQLKGGFKNWKLKKEQSVKTEKKRKVKWNAAAARQAISDVEQAYFRRMSEGYARAASGVVLYVRPDRVPGEEGDWAKSIWAEYELPALKKSRRHRGVIEMTLKYSDNEEDYKTMQFTPGSERQRVEAPTMGL